VLDCEIGAPDDHSVTHIDDLQDAIAGHRPAGARIATRRAGLRVGAFWKPGDPALISLPGARLARRTVNLPLSIVKIRFWYRDRLSSPASGPISKNGPAHEGPRVRILLPPAASLVRTRGGSRHGLGFVAAITSKQYAAAD
jgi:hypothetical protein